MSESRSASWARARALFDELLELGPGERTARLGGVEPALRSEVEALLRHAEDEGPFDSLRGALAPASSAPVGPSPSATRHPERVGPYRILQVIGEGGMGVVYEAEQQEPVRRRVAVKMMKAGLDTREVIGRFEAERQALAVMEHPGIAKVFDGGATEAGHPYFVMELVRGPRLDEYCDRRRLTTRERIALFVGVCEAVQHAHQKGVIHRDLKPSNVLVVEESGRPRVKIIDFGIAKATGLGLSERTVVTTYGQAIGTLAYMSPEQAESSGLDVDTRADIYSLGVIAYELLTGFVPVDPKEVGAPRFLAMLLERDAPTPTPSRRLTSLEPGQKEAVTRLRSTDERQLRRELRGDLQWVVLKAVEKERERRYDSAGSLAADLRRYLAHEPVEAHPPSTGYRLAKFVRRNTSAVSAAAIVFLALAGATVMTYLSRNRALSAQAEAVAEAARAEAVNQFLVTLLGSPNPSQDGRDVRVAEVLDRASETAGEALVGSAVAEGAVHLALGRSYRGLGLYTEALRELARSADIYRDIGDPALGYALQELGGMQAQLGDYATARSSLEESLGAMRAAFGEPSVPVADAVSAIGEVAYFTGDLSGATELFRQALDTYLDVLPEDSEDVINTRANLAVMLQELGEIEESIEMNEGVVRSMIALRGPDHVDVATVSGNLAISLQDAGRLEEAEPLLIDAVRINRAAYGETSDRVARALNNLGAFYRRAGRLEDAERVLRQAVDMNVAVLGEEHAETASNFHNLGLTLMDRGDATAASEAFARAVGINERVRPEHETTGRFRTSLARALLDLGQLDEAEPLLSRAREETVGVFGEDHARVAAVDVALGSYLRRRGRLAQAEELLLDALARLSRTLPPSNADVRAAYRELAATYDALGRPGPAAGYRALLEEPAGGP